MGIDDREVVFFNKIKLNEEEVEDYIFKHADGGEFVEVIDNMLFCRSLLGKIGDSEKNDNELKLLGKSIWRDLNIH